MGDLHKDCRSSFLAAIRVQGVGVSLNGNSTFDFAGAKDPLPKASAPFPEHYNWVEG